MYDDRNKPPDSFSTNGHFRNSTFCRGQWLLSHYILYTSLAPKTHQPWVVIVSAQRIPCSYAKQTAVGQSQKGVPRSKFWAHFWVKFYGMLTRLLTSLQSVGFWKTEYSQVNIFSFPLKEIQSTIPSSLSKKLTVDLSCRSETAVGSCQQPLLQYDFLGI